MEKLQHSPFFEHKDFKDDDLRSRHELSLFAKTVFDVEVAPDDFCYTLSGQAVRLVPEIPRELIQNLMRKLQLFVLHKAQSHAIHLIPPNTPYNQITEDDARVVLLAHDLFASGGVGLEHWMSLSFKYAKKMPLHPSVPGYNGAFLGREDLWMVSRDNISPKKLVDTARVYEPKIAKQLSSTYIHTQARHVLEAIYSHCGHDDGKLALAEALLGRVLREYGKGFIDLDVLKQEVVAVRSTRFQFKSREELVEAVGRIPTARGTGDAKRAKHKPKSSVLPVFRQLDARAPPNFTLGQRGTYERLVNLWQQLSGASGDSDLWLGYASFIESAKKENHEKLLKRIRRVLDGILNGFKLHKANKLSKALFAFERRCKKLEAKMYELKDHLVEAEHSASQQKARAEHNFRTIVQEVSKARGNVKHARMNVEVERNRKAKVAMEDGITLRFPEREENAAFLEKERVDAEKWRLESYAKKNGYESRDWSKFYEEHVEGGARVELNNHSVAQIVDPRETWERISDPEAAPDTAARRELFKTGHRNLHIAQCRAGELVFPEFEASFEKIRADLAKLGISCGDISDDFDAMRARAEAAAERVDNLGVSDETAMLDDSSEDEGSDSELPEDEPPEPEPESFSSQLRLSREQQQAVAGPPPRDSAEDSDEQLEDVEEGEQDPSLVAFQYNWNVQQMQEQGVASASASASADNGKA